MPFVELWRGQVHFHRRSGSRRHRVACRSALVGSATISSRSFPHATTVGLAAASRSLICQVLGSRAAAGGCRLCGAPASRPAWRPVQRKASSVVVRRAGKPHPSNAGGAHCRALSIGPPGKAVSPCTRGLWQTIVTLRSKARVPILACPGWRRPILHARTVATEKRTQSPDATLRCDSNDHSASPVVDLGACSCRGRDSRYACSCTDARLCPSPRSKGTLRPGYRVFRPLRSESNREQ